MSLAQNPVNWFEIPVTDMPRAIAFYTAILEHQLFEHEAGDIKMAFFPMNLSKFGAGGALVCSEGYTPSHEGTLVYFPVADIEATLEKIEAAGGKTLLPKISIGENGHIARFEDSEGNRVGLHTPPTMAG